jgi:amino acid transporter
MNNTSSSSKEEHVTLALSGNTLGLRHAVVISVAVMSPTASIFFNTIPQAGVVGAAIPLCYVIGFVIALLMAHQYSEMSRELPSSGSAFTFVTEGLGSGWGFLTGWIGLAAIAIGAPYSFIMMSANLEALVMRWFAVDIHWSLWFVAAIGIVFALCYRGVRQSLSIDMTFLTFEIGICLVLAGLVLWHVSSGGGLTTEPFLISQVPKGGDLTIGIILAVLSFIGFETAATLGEETSNPHRNIPHAVFGAMVVVGVFYVLMSYVMTVGYGIHNMATGYANDQAPFDTISRQFGGEGLVLLVDLAGILSFFGAALAIINGGARIIYAVGRDGLFPRWLARTHSTYHTPIAAITVLCALGLVSGLILGIILTPINAFAFLGTLDALLLLLIYILVNISCIRFFWKKRRDRFNILRHVIFPVLSTLIMSVIFVAAFVEPGAAPLSFVPYVVVVWIVLGMGILFALRGKIMSDPMQLLADGDVYAARGEYTAAVSVYEKVIQLNPSCMSAYLNMGIALSALKQYAEALDVYEKGIQVQTHADSSLQDKAYLYGNKAYVLNILGRYTEALESCNQALRLDPASVIACINKDVALNNLKRVYKKPSVVLFRSASGAKRDHFLYTL